MKYQSDEINHFIQNPTDRPKNRYLATLLLPIFKAFPSLFESVEGLGLMRGIKCQSGDILASVIKKAFEHGVLVLKAGKNTLRFLPPLTISKEEMNEGFKRLESACNALL